MKKVILLLLAPIWFTTLTAQNPDAISGATLAPEYMDRYLADDGVRAWYNNDNFDNESFTPLRGVLPRLEGEILNPGQIRFWECDSRTVVVKEALSGDNGEPYFVGAFRYRGYSLADLVKDAVVEKANREEYNLRVDMYVLVENADGESAVFSWGELFYSKRGQDIIFATQVSPVFPSDTTTRWSSPTSYRIVAGNDMLAVRNIENPVRIVLKSFPRSFPGEKGFRPLYAAELKIEKDGQETVISKIPKSMSEISFNTVFFGSHRGFKHITEFKGYPFDKLLRERFTFTDEDLRNGLIGIGAKDSYRIVWSLSEILNRADTESVMIQDYEKHEDGRFIILPTADFFADRRLKGSSQAYIINGAAK